MVYLKFTDRKGLEDIFPGQKWKVFRSQFEQSNPRRKNSKPSVFSKPRGPMHALRAAGLETCGNRLDLGAVPLRCRYPPQHMGGTKGTFFSAEKKQIKYLRSPLYIVCLGLLRGQ